MNTKLSKPEIMGVRWEVYDGIIIVSFCICEETLSMGGGGRVGGQKYTILIIYYSILALF